MDSEVGKGTSFDILLPAVRERVDTTEVALPKDVSEPGPRNELRTVLVVEDEPALRRAAVRMLSEGGYQVLSAASGPKALTLLEAFDGTVDLMFVDVVMEEMSGIELVEAVHRDQPGIAVLYTSGYMQEKLGAQGFLPEDVALLRKPYEPDMLLRTVEMILASK